MFGCYLMSNSLVNAYTVIIIFFIGYFFKRFKLVNLDTAKKLSYVVMYITLPCAILSGTAGAIDISVNLYYIVPIAFVISFLMPCIGYFIFHKDPKQCVFGMLNLGGFNIGNFVLPFMQSILTPEGFIALCLFDVVNAFFFFFVVYCMSLWFNRNGFNNGDTINLKKILIELSKSITSYCCILSIVLSASGIEMPFEVLHPVKMIGASNSFLCMFVIGVALNFDVSFTQINKILKMLFIRYFSALLFALLVWFCLPYSQMLLLVLVAIVFAPITSLAPITAIRSLPEFAEDSANLNMISVITSVIIITLLNAFAPLFMTI